MNSRNTGRRALAVLASTLVGVGSFGAAAHATPSDDASSQAPSVKVSLGGASYGAYAYDHGKKHVTGPVGRAAMHCVYEGGLSNKGNAAGTDLGALGNGGVTDSSVKTFEEDGWKGTTSSTKIAGAKLLNGLVKVGALTSTTVGRTNGGNYEATNTSDIASLTVAGRPIDVNAKPNTKVELTLPGLGSIGEIHINKQTKGWYGEEYRANTEALHIDILKDNPLGLKVGSTVKLGVSGVVLSRPITTALGGNGFATKASVGGKLLSHGPLASAYMPCGGGSSTGRVEVVNLPGVLEAGAAVTKVKATYETSGANGVVTNKIAGVKILGDVITADALTAQATVSKDFTTFDSLGVQQMLRPASAGVQLSDEGTEFVNLKVAGKLLATADIAPNTKINVAELGTVTLRKTVKAGNRISVTMIEVEIGNPDLGLDVGTKVEIGYASAVAKG